MKLPNSISLGRSLAFLLCLLGGSHLSCTAHAQEVGARRVDQSKTGKTLGFVFTSFHRQTYLGKDGEDCPDGFVRRGIDGLFENISKSERDRLNRPGNAQERKKVELISQRGELCLRPDWLPAKPHRLVQSKISYGIDLDGGDTTHKPALNTCRHDNFTGLNGEAGIDNQYYRAVGCMNTWFRASSSEGNVPRDLSWLMEITGVDDMRNDDEVWVGLYAGSDPLEVALGTAEVLPHVTLDIDTNPRFAADKHVPARGRIENGVVTAGPIDFMFRTGMPGEEVQYRFRGAQARLELSPDGSTKGTIAGYQDVESAYWEQAVLGFLGNTGYFCPSFYAALKAMADGYPDPSTGECTGISTAFSVAAVPAFVIHPTPEQFAAAAAAKPPHRPYGWDRLVEKREGLSGGNEEFVQALRDEHPVIAPIVERELARRAKNKSAAN